MAIQPRTRQATNEKTNPAGKIPLLKDWRIGAVLVVCLAAGAGWLAAGWMPHGPATAGQALLTLVGGLALGITCGWLLPSRWSGLLAVLAHITALELTRLDVPGPTVDGLRLDSTYGILALVLGRGFHGLVGLLPLLAGASLGSSLAQAASRRQTWRISVGQGAALAGLVLLAVALALPASTPAIVGADGQPLPGSIAEISTPRINGQELGLLIRSQSVDNPIILYLSGGPGQSSLPYPRVIFQDLEQDFIMVALDQRGTGKSYAALDPTAELTLDQAVDDVLAVAHYLCERFDEDKVYLLGESWGTTP